MKRDRGKIAVLVILWLGTTIVAVMGLFNLFVFLADPLGQLPWYLRAVPFAAFWLILLIPQLYMVAITLLYLERNKQEINSWTEGSPA